MFSKKNIINLFFFFNLAFFSFSISNTISAQLQLKKFAGLPNKGQNLCFANSVFKLLSVHPDIDTILQSHTIVSQMMRDQDSEIEQKIIIFKEKLQILITAIRSDSLVGNVDKVVPFSIIEPVIEAFKKTKEKSEETEWTGRGQFPGRQHDASEFLRAVLNILEVESKFKFKTEIINKRPGETPTSLAEPDDLFISVSIEENKTIEQLIKDTILNTEEIRNAVNEIILIKKTSFLQIPNAAIFSLNRFQTFAKISRRINSVVRLSDPLRIPVQIDGQEQILQFKPKAVICHLSGVMDAGHYITYIKDITGWIEHNDSYVGPPREPDGTPKDAIKDIEKNGYVFLYIKDKEATQRAQAIVPAPQAAREATQPPRQPATPSVPRVSERPRAPIPQRSLTPQVTPPVPMAARQPQPPVPPTPVVARPSVSAPQQPAFFSPSSTPSQSAHIVSPPIPMQQGESDPKAAQVGTQKQQETSVSQKPEIKLSKQSQKLLDKFNAILETAQAYLDSMEK